MNDKPQVGSIKKNLGYQTIYQLLATCLPLITSPYLSRVLGAEQLGIYSYTNSIVLYFTLFAMLGTVNYGTRSIAGVRDDLKECGNVFWSIFSIQAITSVASLVLYGCYLLFVCKKYHLIAILQIFQILNCLLDINWLFFGLEEFKTTVIRNFIVKAISFVMLFVLVQSESDLWLYTILMAGSNIVSQIFLWIKLPKFCRFRKIPFSGIIRHIKPNLVLFVPLLAVSVYHVMDKTMLGIMSTEVESGYYYNADKLINIPLVIINGIGTVLLPRVSNLIEHENHEEVSNLVKISIEGVIMVSAAMACGIASVANAFVPLFFGDGFYASISITNVLAPVLIAKGVSNTIRSDYLIPYHLESKYSASVIAGAVTNLIANTLLIPKYGGVGAAIGTLLAELISCICQIVAIAKRINLSKTLRHGASYIIIGLVMFAAVRRLSSLVDGNLNKIFIGVVSGVVVYTSLCVIYLKITRNHLLDTLLGSKLGRSQ